MIFISGDLVKVVNRRHSCFDHEGVFISEFAVPNTKLEKPLYKIFVKGDFRLMLINEFVKLQ